LTEVTTVITDCNDPPPTNDQHGGPCKNPKDGERRNNYFKK